MVGRDLKKTVFDFSMKFNMKGLTERNEVHSGVKTFYEFVKL